MPADSPRQTDDQSTNTVPLEMPSEIRNEPSKPAKNEAPTQNSVPSWILGVVVIMLCAMRVFSN